MRAAQIAVVVGGNADKRAGAVGRIGKFLAVACVAERVGEALIEGLCVLHALGGIPGFPPLVEILVEGIDPRHSFLLCGGGGGFNQRAVGVGL